MPGSFSHSHSLPHSNTHSHSGQLRHLPPFRPQGTGEPGTGGGECTPAPCRHDRLRHSTEQSAGPACTTTGHRLPGRARTPWPHPHRWAPPTDQQQEGPAPAQLHPVPPAWAPKVSQVQLGFPLQAHGWPCSPPVATEAQEDSPGLFHTYRWSQKGTNGHFCSVSRQNTESDRREVSRETSETVLRNSRMCLSRDKFQFSPTLSFQVIKEKSSDLWNTCSP